MSMPDAAEREPQHPHVANDPATGGLASAAPAQEAETETSPREPVIEQVEREVTIERSVRYGRLLILGAIVGAFVLVVVALLLPMAADAEYSRGQIVTFSMMLGAAIGLALSGILAVVLGASAKRRRGGAVAIQTDVR